MNVLFVESVFMALFGLGIEVFFTSMGRAKLPHLKRRHLAGHSSVWYMPLYGLTPTILHALSDTGFFDLPILLRSIAYLLIIWSCELPWMWVLRKVLGSSPSERAYYASGRSVAGLIRWDFFIPWMIAGLILEYAHGLLHSLPH